MPLLSIKPLSQNLAKLLILLLPAGLIGIRSMGSVLCLLLCVVSLFFLRSQKHFLNKYDYFFFIALLLPLMITIIQGAFIGDIKDKYYEIALRFAVPLSVFLLFRRIKVSTRWLGIGSLLGLLVILGIVCIRHFVFHIDRPSNYFMNTLPFSGTAVVFSFLAFFLLSPFFKHLQSQTFFGAAIFAIAVFILIITQSRGPLLALVIAGIVFLLSDSRLPFKLKSAVFVIVPTLAVILFFANTDIRQRAEITATEINTNLIRSDYRPGSISYRLQMWKAAGLIFEQSPFFGVGRGNYPAALADVVRKEEIHYVPTFGHAHNEIMTILAEQGIVGFIGYLLLLGVPLSLFIRHRKSEDSRIQAPAYAGISVVLVYFLLGLTNVVFLQMSILTFYSVMVCYLASQIIHYRDFAVSHDQVSRRVVKTIYPRGHSASPSDLPKPVSTNDKN